MAWFSSVDLRCVVENLESKPRKLNSARLKMRICDVSDGTKLRHG